MGFWVGEQTSVGKGAVKRKGEDEGPGQAGRSAGPESGGRRGQPGGTAAARLVCHPLPPPWTPSPGPLRPTRLHAGDAGGHVCLAQRTLLQAATCRACHAPLTPQTQGRAGRPAQPTPPGPRPKPALRGRPATRSRPGVSARPPHSPSFRGDSDGWQPRSLSLSHVSLLPRVDKLTPYPTFLWSPGWTNSPHRLFPHVGFSSLKSL